MVRNYVEFFHKSLCPGGRIALLNLEVSRQSPHKTVYAHGLESFALSEIVVAPFSNWQIKPSHGLKYLCCRATK